MFKIIIQATRATLLVAILTGLLFPLAVTFISQICFPNEANGSLIKAANGSVIGSSLIAQSFSKPQYFHSRPSAAGAGYAGEASSASNLGPTSKKLIDGDKGFDGVKQLVASYRKENDLSENELVPVDAVTRSGSGLDPHISLQNAHLQARRVASSRHCTASEIDEYITLATDSRQFGVLGEPGVNVLRLNQILDANPKIAFRR